MVELLIRLGRLSVGFLIMMGPLILFLVFLKLRDDRESVLHTMVLKKLNSPELRGLFAVKIKCGLFSRQDTVVVELWDCPKEQVWDTIIHLSNHLPLQVRLVVNGMADFQSRWTVTLKAQRRIPSVGSVSCCR
jgi:hypothetical protein